MADCTEQTQAQMAIRLKAQREGGLATDTRSDQLAG